MIATTFRDDLCAGTMRRCMAARPLLARSGGAIVNTSSMLAFFGGGLVSGYSASKGGRRAADEIAGNCLCSG